MSFLSKTAVFEEASDHYGSIGDPSLLFTQISTKNFSNTVEQKILRRTTQREKEDSFISGCIIPSSKLLRAKRDLPS